MPAATISRRHALAMAGGAMLASFLPWPAAAQKFDLATLKDGYRRRLEAIHRRGVLPVIDIESSYNPLNVDLPALVRDMDDAGIAQMALSVDQPGELVREGETWNQQAFDLVRDHPQYFIPTGNGANHPAWTRSPDRFLDDNERYIVESAYPLMGEFEFRHYPSPRQVQRGEWHRDVTIPIDGPQGHRLFAFAERTGIPFQIHYEIEDDLLTSLETMLARYPRAKVVWCHVAQVRYRDRTRCYGAAYLRDLFARFPGLYVDTAFGSAYSVYKPSGERHATIWNNSGDIPAEWKELILDQPYRFLAALDLGGDRTGRLDEWASNLRNFLNHVPESVRAIVAHGSAWKLLFGEEIILG